jgi:hypothetical protein
VIQFDRLVEPAVDQLDRYPYLGMPKPKAASDMGSDQPQPRHHSRRRRGWLH